MKTKAQKLRSFIVSHKIITVGVILVGFFIIKALVGIIASPIGGYKSCFAFASDLTNQLSTENISLYHGGAEVQQAAGPVKGPNLSSVNKSDIHTLKCFHQESNGPYGRNFSSEYEMSGIDSDGVDFYVHGVQYASPNRSSGGGSEGKQYCYIAPDIKYTYMVSMRESVQPGRCMWAGDRTEGYSYEYKK